MARSQDSVFSSVKFTLQAALQHKGQVLPLVVKSCGKLERNEATCQETGCLRKGDVMLLEKKSVIEYAHIRVLKFHDDAKVTSEKGKSFLEDRNSFVGEEFFMPLRYPCKLTLVHRPGKRLRYAAVSQVMDDLPHYLRVDADVMAIPPRNMGHNQLVSSSTEIEIKSIVTPVYENTRYLRCTNGTMEYMFNEKCPINFTALPDYTEYTLSEVAEDILLPKVVQFQDYFATDVVEEEDEMAKNVLTVMGGPVEVLEIVSRNVLVGWIGNATVLIPEEVWNKEIVYLMLYKTDREKNIFIQNTFKTCNNSLFVSDKLYLLKGPVIKWLRRPPVTLHEPAEEDIYEISDPDSDSSGYESPTPPVPPRPPRPWAEPPLPPPSLETSQPEHSHYAPIVQVVQLPTVKPQEKQDFLQMVVKKSKIGFSNVHHELKSFFKSKHGKRKTPIYYQSTTTETDETVVVGGDQPAGNVPLSKKRLPSMDRPLPPLPHEVFGDTALQADGDDEDDDLHDYDYPLVEFGRKSDKKTPNYFRLTVKEVTKIARANQTSEDFYQYNVQEVSQCFQMCALDKLAKVCMEQRLDGSFLRTYEDLDSLMEEPFGLSKFEIRKLKYVIHDGWRPKDHIEDF